MKNYKTTKSKSARQPRINTPLVARPHLSQLVVVSLFLKRGGKMTKQEKKLLINFCEEFAQRIELFECFSRKQVNIILDELNTLIISYTNTIKKAV